MGVNSRKITEFLLIPRADWTVTPDDIRSKNNDKKAANEIFEEFTTVRDYEEAICRAVMKFNRSGNPRTYFNPATFPELYEELLINLAYEQILLHILSFKAQNVLSGSNAGTNVNVHQNLEAIMALYNVIKQTNDAELLDLKTGANIDNTAGSIIPLDSSFNIGGYFF